MFSIRMRAGTPQRSLAAILGMRLRGLFKPSHQPVPGQKGMFAGSLVSRDAR